MFKRFSSRGIVVSVPEDHGATDVLDVSERSAVVQPHDYPEDTYHACWYYFGVANKAASRSSIKITLQNLPIDPPYYGGKGYEPFWKNSVWSTDRMNWKRITDKNQKFGESSVEIQMDLGPEESRWIAETYPVTYQDYSNLMEQLPNYRGSELEREKILLGKTEKGRPLYAVKFTSPSSGDKKVMLLVSGQHAVEESGKIFTHTVIQWLNENYRISKAREVLRNCEVYVVPLANPDGCYDGRMNTNAKGENPLIDACVETQCIFKLIDEIKPSILINAHGWGNLLGKAPHEGWYHWDESDPFYLHMKKNMYGVGSVDEPEKEGAEKPSDHIIKEDFKIENYAHSRYGTYTGILEIDWNSYKPSADAREVRPTLHQIRKRSLEYFLTASSMLI